MTRIPSFDDERGFLKGASEPLDTRAGARDRSILLFWVDFPDETKFGDIARE